jgi:hypothetical protein
MRPHAPLRTLTLLASVIAFVSACTTDDSQPANIAAASRSASPDAPQSTRWLVVPDANADQADQAFLDGSGEPLEQFMVATRPMTGESFYTRERCIAFTQHTLPRVADDINALLQLASQLHNDTFRDAVTMNMKVKNAALIVCSSGREVGTAGRDLINTTNESIDAHLNRLVDIEANAIVASGPAGPRSEAPSGIHTASAVQ